MTTKNSQMINWDNVFRHSKTFQERKPTKWAFLEEFFVRDFYEKLYETYPKKDDSWFVESSNDKSAYRKWWTGNKDDHFASDVEDPNFSKSWFSNFFRESPIVFFGSISNFELNPIAVPFNL